MSTNKQMVSPKTMGTKRTHYIPKHAAAETIHISRPIEALLMMFVVIFAAGLITLIDNSPIEPETVIAPATVAKPMVYHTEISSLNDISGFVTHVEGPFWVDPIIIEPSIAEVGPIVIDEAIEEVVEEPIEEMFEIEEVEVIPPTPMEVFTTELGNDFIDLGVGTLTRFELPIIYYPSIDYSSFQPWMNYKVITDRSSQAWKVVSDERMYVDENGMCRFAVDPDSQFTVDGKDDFVIALATYYKPKGTCGSRWLVVTSTGMYTAITGDEKDDGDTDEHNMFSKHSGKAGMIEWLVDSHKLNRSAKRMGSITYAPVEALQGEILYMYRID